MRTIERAFETSLGLFSLGLGTTQLLAPDRVNRLIGVKDNPRTRALQRAVGVQELGAAGGIAAMSPPRPVFWTRVAGDVGHLAMLSRAYTDRKNDRTRLKWIIGSVVGVTALDVLAGVASRRSAREDTEAPIGASTPGNPSITIRASREEIEQRLAAFDIQEYGDVTFTAAPGGRGTEVHVDLKKRANPLKKIVGEDPDQKVRDNLRRLKQVIEVGEIVVSDATPEGVTAKRQMKQRPAQPLDEKELAKVGRGS